MGDSGRLWIIEELKRCEAEEILKIISTCLMDGKSWVGVIRTEQLIDF